MALINCPECGKEISSNAKNCPNCGNPINLTKEQIQGKIQNRKNNKLITSWGFPSMIFTTLAFIDLFFFQDNKHKILCIIAIICAIIPIFTLKKNIPVKIVLVLIILINAWFFSATFT